MMIDLFRWAEGYVYFEAKGKHLERFIGLCLKDRLFLWSPKKRGEQLTAFMSAKDYLKIRSCARNSGSHIHILKKAGLPFLLKKHRYHFGIPIGLLLSLFLLHLSTFFLWDITFTGNVKLSDEELSRFLMEKGVYAGAFKPNLSIEDVQQEAMLRFPELSWIAVNIFGGIAQVEVREGTPSPPLVNHDTPRNLVAKKSGEILRIEDLDGTAVVQPGDQVLPGDLLISGIMEDGVGKITLRQALGRVIAKTRYNKEYTIPLHAEIEEPTGRMAKRFSLKIYGIEIPLSFTSDDPFSSYLTSSYLHPWEIFDVPLGISLQERIFYETKPQPVTRTQQEAKEMAQVLLAKDLDGEEFVNIKILEKRLFAESDGSQYTLRAEIICEEDIETEKEILWRD